jgi:small subunit ribosomal protein S1
MVNGTVKSVDAKGVVVDLGDDIEGYLRASEISNDRVEDARNAYKEGDAVTAMVINVDRKARSIALSIKAKDQVDTDEAMKKIAEESAGSAGTTSLGALLKAKLGNNQ